MPYCRAHLVIDRRGLEPYTENLKNLYNIETLTTAWIAGVSNYAGDLLFSSGKIPSDLPQQHWKDHLCHPGLWEVASAHVLAARTTWSAFGVTGKVTVRIASQGSSSKKVAGMGVCYSRGYMVTQKVQKWGTWNGR